MESWEDIRAWRRSMRSELRATRGALPIGEKEIIRLKVCDLTRENFPELSAACIRFYWPCRTGFPSLQHFHQRDKCPRRKLS